MMLFEKRFIKTYFITQVLEEQMIKKQSKRVAMIFQGYKKDCAYKIELTLLISDEGKTATY